MRHFLFFFLLLLSLQSHGQQQALSPADWEGYRVKALRYDSLQGKYNRLQVAYDDLHRCDVKQQATIDQLTIDLKTSNAGNAQLRLCLFGEIDYNQSLEISLIGQKKEWERIARKERRRNAKLARAYIKRQQYESLTKSL